MIIFRRVFRLQTGHKYALKSNKEEITQKVLKRRLSFLYATHRHDLFYITVKYHQNIPNGIQVFERSIMFTDGRTPDSSLYPPNHSVGDKNVIGVRVLVLCTSSDDDLYLFKVSFTYSQWY